MISQNFYKKLIRPSQSFFGTLRVPNFCQKTFGTEFRYRLVPKKNCEIKVIVKYSVLLFLPHWLKGACLRKLALMDASVFRDDIRVDSLEFLTWELAQVYFQSCTSGSHILSMASISSIAKLDHRILQGPFFGKNGLH